MLQFVGDQAQQLQTQYGNISAASIGAIQRGLLNLEEQGEINILVSRPLNLMILFKPTQGEKE